MSYYGYDKYFINNMLIDGDKLNSTYGNNKNFMLLAVSRFGSDLQYASDELRNDKEIVLAAVKNNASALKYASSDLKKTRTLLQPQ